MPEDFITEDRAKLLIKEEMETCRRGDENEKDIGAVAKARADGDKALHGKTDKINGDLNDRIDKIWNWINKLLVMTVFECIGIIVMLAIIILKK